MRNIGVDLHKNSFVVCILTKEKKEKRRYKISEIEKFAKELRKTDRVAVESTNNTRYFAEQIKEKVKEIKIVKKNTKSCEKW